MVIRQSFRPRRRRALRSVYGGLAESPAARVGLVNTRFHDALEKAVGKGLIARMEAVRLQKIHNARDRSRDEGSATTDQGVEAALEFYIQLLEKSW